MGITNYQTQKQEESTGLGKQNKRIFFIKKYEYFKCMSVRTLSSKAGKCWN